MTDLHEAAREYQAAVETGDQYAVNRAQGRFQHAYHEKHGVNVWRAMVPGKVAEILGGDDD